MSVGRCAPAGLTAWSAPPFCSILRSAAGLTVPMLDPISMKLSLVDEYDSTPSDDVDRNSLFMTAGLSVGW